MTPHHTISHHARAICTHHTASHHVPLHDITSHHTPSHHITPLHTTSHQTSSHLTPSHHITPHPLFQTWAHARHHITPHHTTSHRIKSHHATSYHTAPFHTTSHLNEWHMDRTSPTTNTTPQQTHSPIQPIYILPDTKSNDTNTKKLKWHTIPYLATNIPDSPQ